MSSFCFESLFIIIIMTVLLSSTYFGPVQWYQKLNRYDTILIEQHDSFIKQTYRNRCVIATPNGPLSLTVPTKPQAFPDGQSAQPLSQPTLNTTLVSDHGNWRHVHWNALKSAYGESPFFEYYADDIKPFFEKRWERLYDFNMDICRVVCGLLDIEPRITLTDHYITAEEAKERGIADFRDAIRPKHPLADPDFVPRKYYQVYSQRHGFLPNMSILDLLFNMGNESILWL